MSVQPSLIIWTVICFCLFAFVLYRLLFKPVLELMDARGEKLENAKRLALEQSERLKEQQRLLEERRIAEAEALEAERQERLALLRRESDAELKRLAAEAEKRRAETAEGCKKLAAETAEQIGSYMDKMTEVFTDKLVSGGRG